MTEERGGTAELTHSSTRRGWKEAAWCAATALVSLAVAIPSLGLMSWNSAYPFAIGEDRTQLSMQLKTIHEFGWYWFNPDLGFPMGLNGSWFPELNVLHVALVRLIDLVVGNGFTAGGIYFVIAFPLTGVTMYLLARSQGLSPVAGFVGGVLLANAPGHAGRYGHLYLAQYWVVPVALWLVLEVARGRSLWSGRVFGRVPRRAVTVAAVICVGWSGAYYVGFTLLLIVAAALARRAVGTPRDLLRGGAVALGLMAAIAVPLVMAKIGTARDLVTGTVPATRLPSESETYAGKLMDLVLPWPDHRIDVLASITRTYDATSPQSTVEVSALGMVGVVGLLILSAAGLTALLAGRRLEPDVGRWSGLALFSFLLYTIGGLGSFIAFFATPQLRTWSRMSVFLLALALLAVGRALTRLERKRGLVAAIAVGALVTAVGVLDQTNPEVAPDHVLAQRTVDGLQHYVADLESEAGSDCGVFQIPVVAYPESGPYLGMDDYDQLAPYLPTSSLRLSAGAMRGTSASTWMRAIDTGDLQELGKDLRSAGFCAIEVDSRGFSSGDDPRRRLAGAFGGPVAATPDDELVAYRLPEAAWGPSEQDRRTEHLLHPVLVSLEAYAPERVSGVVGQYVGPTAILAVANPGNTTRRVTVDLVVTGEGSDAREVAIERDGEVLARGSATASSPARLSISVEAARGLTNLKLTVSGPIGRAESGGTPSTAFVSVLSARSGPGVRAATEQEQVETGWVAP